MNMSLLIKKLKKAREKQEREELEKNSKIVNIYYGNSPVNPNPQYVESHNYEIPKINHISKFQEGRESSLNESLKSPKEMKLQKISKKEKVEIPDKDIHYSKKDMIDENEDLKNLNLKYSLIPRNAKNIKESFAWAEIKFDSENERLVYRVVELPLSKDLEEKLKTIEEILKDNLDVSFEELKKDEAKKFLSDKIREVVNYYKLSLSESEKRIVEYYAFRNFIGLGKIEPLMNDPYIEDISCDGNNIPIYVYHRHPNLGSIQTNIQFERPAELDSFVIKLSQRSGRTISVAEPLLDGSLTDGSRVQATLGTDIARRGSNFTIRKFTEDPLTPIHLMNFGTIDETMLAYLWLTIEYGKSILIVGPTAAGKTSILNALSLFIRPEMKIVSIEDTPELRLPHPNWVPEVARSGFGFGSMKSGEITLDDLLKESLRQRPDYIIVGEVRGKEAYILFQQIATGHPGLSTIHASSLDKVMDRLTTKPIELSPSLIENLDILLFIKSLRKSDKYIRRVENILELEGFDQDAIKPLVNPIFQWNPEKDSFFSSDGSVVLASIAKENGLSVKDLQNELIIRKKILKWMNENGVRSYKKVGRIIQSYYSNPQALVDLING